MLGLGHRAKRNKPNDSFALRERRLVGEMVLPLSVMGTEEQEHLNLDSGGKELTKEVTSESLARCQNTSCSSR